MDDITKWLNERGTYHQGVALLLKHQPGHRLADLFTQEQQSDFKAKKLHQALLQLATQQPAAAIVPAAPPAATAGPDPAAPGSTATEHTPARIPGQWSHPDARDAVENRLHGQWHPLFLERANLQSRIYEVAKAGTTNRKKRDEACRMAHRILDLERSIKRIYQQRDQYLVTGQEPAADPDAVQYAQDPILAAKDLENRRKYVRTFRTKLKSNPDDTKAQQLLQQHLAAVEHYERFFKIRE